MKNTTLNKLEELARQLKQMDGRGYKAYKAIKGEYNIPGLFTLFIDHVQGDPFAEPTKIRARLPQSVADYPASLFSNKVRRVALQDFLTRGILSSIKSLSLKRQGSGKSGLITMDHGGQEVIERTSVLITKDFVEARLYVGLPADGRRILGRSAVEILCTHLPVIVEKSMPWANQPQESLTEFVECIENQEYIRDQLESRRLVAFVADGSSLPRESGVSDRPLSGEEAVPFRTPESLKVTVDLCNPVRKNGKDVQSITGMGLPTGVTLIVGGGYHGKSTLLKALERGVYPHIPGDGREYVVTTRDAVKIRSEDGRRVEQLDISAFINNLPYGRGTSNFSTDNASGSTSQAANIVEAMEMGTDLLLLDEDTSATNFMIRDVRMMALVSKENEPITPFLDRIQGLYQKMKISTILVMGGSGDYFSVASTVVMMKNFQATDVTEEARKIADSFNTTERRERPPDFLSPTGRIPIAHSFDPSRGKREVKIDVRELGLLLFGTTPIDLGGVEQIVDQGQTRAIGYAIHLASQRFMKSDATLRQVLEELGKFFDEYGCDALDPYYGDGEHPGHFARPRRFEIAAAINRLRTLKMKQKG